MPVREEDLVGNDGKRRRKALTGSPALISTTVEKRNVSNVVVGCVLYKRALCSALGLDVGVEAQKGR